MVQGKVSISGGDGANRTPPEDGSNGTETKDAKHLWNFGNWRLSTMIYNDLMRVKAGRENSGLADAAIPDGENGPSATSLETPGRLRRCGDKTRPSHRAPLNVQAKARGRAT